MAETPIDESKTGDFCSYVFHAKCQHENAIQSQQMLGIKYWINPLSIQFVAMLWKRWEITCNKRISITGYTRTFRIGKAYRYLQQTNNTTSTKFFLSLFSHFSIMFSRNQMSCEKWKCWKQKKPSLRPHSQYIVYVKCWFAFVRSVEFYQIIKSRSYFISMNDKIIQWTRIYLPHTKCSFAQTILWGKNPMVIFFLLFTEIN